MPRPIFARLSVAALAHNLAIARRYAAGARIMAVLKANAYLIDGRRARTVGRVSMDMIVVALTDHPEANVGTQATLWGEGLSADEVAQSAGSISYELLCAVAPRVPMIEGP